MNDFGDFGKSPNKNSGDFGSPPNIFENLPEDPEKAFLVLEREFRREADERFKKARENDDTGVIYADYIAQVIAAINELGLQAEFDNRVPRIEDVNYTTYVNFSKDVKHYRTMLEIRHGRRVQGYSVRFDTASRAKVQHHLQQLRDIFEKLELEIDKKEKLFDKLNALQKEVDRERTPYDSYAALTVETAGVVGDVVEKSRILDLFDAIGRVIWGAKKEQETKRLPAPAPQKRIEPPKVKRGDMDDEIPF
jgi:hypothetical protein